MEHNNSSLVELYRFFTNVFLKTLSGLGNKMEKSDQYPIQQVNWFLSQLSEPLKVEFQHRSLSFDPLGS